MSHRQHSNSRLLRHFCYISFIYRTMKCDKTYNSHPTLGNTVQTPLTIKKDKFA